MSPLAGASATLASAGVAWLLSAAAARRRRIGLGTPPVVVLAGATLFAVLVPPHDLARAVLLGGIAVAAVCDARTGLIFRPLTTLLAVSTLATASLEGHAAGAASGALALGAVLFALHALTAGRGIGLGDVRLGIGLGAGLGPGSAFLALGWAFVLGGAAGTILLATKRARRGSTIRFAPFMAAGAVAALTPAVLLS